MDYKNEALAVEIAQAVLVLKNGGVVAFPTETVYGLGADAMNEKAIKRIYEIKKRPFEHPLIVHIADLKQFEWWAIDIPKIAWKLAQAFWPGPLTLICRKSKHVLGCVTGGRETVGIRIPSHPVAQILLREFAGGVAAPSANCFGRVSPTKAWHVEKDLGKETDIILDGGRCDYGLESTIIDVSVSNPRLLRHGAISLDAINSLLECSLDVLDQPSAQIQAPGMLTAHYAPKALLRLVSFDSLCDEIEKASLMYKKIVVFTKQQQPVMHKKGVDWVFMPVSPTAYAYELYSKLHDADKFEYSLIIVEQPPLSGDWFAIHDRLKKAERGSGIARKL